MDNVNIMWFRRDLRTNDNNAFFQALSKGMPVLPLFIFDIEILNQLEKNDRRVEFIHLQLVNLNREFNKYGSSLKVYYGKPPDVFKNIINEFRVENVFCNEDYEPYAIKRDKSVADFLFGAGIKFHSFKDHVIFAKDEVVKEDGKPYTVFTPYSRKWLNRLQNHPPVSYDPISRLSNLLKINSDMPSLESIGFIPSGIPFPPSQPDNKIISSYKQNRDFPGITGTSKLGMHLRFGTISIRELVKASHDSPVFLNELIWREFYQSILWHFPHVANQSFKPAYNNIQWRNNEEEFQKWCEGKTGYPIVDAGMNELNSTGFMHNRVRMITASFLCKHLLIDWRWGEAYFANHLLDYELASNNGGWQWAAGSGCDAVPYFRIFNPYLQAKKFDPKSIYIRKWVPDFENDNYHPPIVQHEFARKRCLEVYSKALKKD